MNLLDMDQEDFSEQTGRYRRELLVHCYRMMGGLQDAEDLVQETFLRAWRRRETYEGRASVRAWLYKIATNACLDALDKQMRRMVPMTRGAAAHLDEPIPPDVKEPIWLEPFPDEWLVQDETEPDDHLAAREQITLAFITVLHLLPPRQRAILILRDVLEWETAEVADLLGVTHSSVKSALHRARETMSNHKRAKLETHVPPTLEASRLALLAAYVKAWQTAAVDELVALLREDATFSMPPIPAWYRGRATVGGLIARTVFAGTAHGRWHLLPTRANGQIAYGLYRLDVENKRYAAYGIQVLTFSEGLIADIITFRNPVLVGKFKLPDVIPTGT